MMDIKLFLLTWMQQAQAQNSFVSAQAIVCVDNSTIHQKTIDNPYSSVSNNFIRTFYERTNGKPESFVMKE